MWDWLRVETLQQGISSAAEDIAAAGTALAGLILVYLGTLAVRHESLDKADKRARPGGMRDWPWLA